MKATLAVKSMAAAGLGCWLAWQMTGCGEASLQPAAPDHLAWFTDLPQAQARAREEKRWVLIDFEGSDWCPGCRELQNKVFAMPDFADYAARALVLVKLDFPRKTPQPAGLAKANEEWREKFDVEGFPTLILLDSDGKMLAQFNYAGGGSKDFIAQLEKLKAAKGAAATKS